MLIFELCLRLYATLKQGRRVENTHYNTHFTHMVNHNTNTAVTLCARFTSQPFSSAGLWFALAHRVAAFRSLWLTSLGDVREFCLCFVWRVNGLFDGEPEPISCVLVRCLHYTIRALKYKEDHFIGWTELLVTSTVLNQSGFNKEFIVFYPIYLRSSISVSLTLANAYANIWSMLAH